MPLTFEEQQHFQRLMQEPNAEVRLMMAIEHAEALKAAEMVRRQAEYDQMRANGYYYSGNLNGWEKMPIDD